MAARAAAAGGCVAALLPNAMLPFGVESSTTERRLAQLPATRDRAFLDSWTLSRRITDSACSWKRRGRNTADQFTRVLRNRPGGSLPARPIAERIGNLSSRAGRSGRYVTDGLIANYTDNICCAADRACLGNCNSELCCAREFFA